MTLGTPISRLAGLELLKDKGKPRQSEDWRSQGEAYFASGSGRI